MGDIEQLCGGRIKPCSSSRAAWDPSCSPAGRPTNFLAAKCRHLPSPQTLATRIVPGSSIRGEAPSWLGFGCNFCSERARVFPIRSKRAHARGKTGEGDAEICLQASAIKKSRSQGVGNHRFCHSRHEILAPKNLDWS